MLDCLSMLSDFDKNPSKIEFNNVKRHTIGNNKSRQNDLFAKVENGPSV